MIKTIVLLSITLLMTACSYNVPKTLDEMRTRTKKSPDSFQSYTVNRSLKDITQSIKAYKHCFKLDTPYQPDAPAYKRRTITLLPKKDKTIFYIQDKFVYRMALAPQIEQHPDGLFMILVDIFKQSKNSVKVDLYGAPEDSELAGSFTRVVKAWIKGDKGCIH